VAFLCRLQEGLQSAIAGSPVWTASASASDATLQFEAVSEIVLLWSLIGIPLAEQI